MAAPASAELAPTAAATSCAQIPLSLFVQIGSGAPTASARSQAAALHVKAAVGLQVSSPWDGRNVVRLGSPVGWPITA
jgi:hypothetical protein